MSDVNPPSDFSIPTDFGGPGFFSSARDRIMQDPGLRLSFLVEQKKAQTEAKNLNVKRYTDSAVLPVILKDMEDSQAQANNINQQIQEWSAKQQTPYPIREIAKLGWQDLVGPGVVAATGAPVTPAIASAQTNAQAISDNQTQGAQQQWSADQQHVGQMLKNLQQQYEQAGSRTDHLHDLQLQEMERIGAMQHNDLEKARDRFQKATEEGDVRQAAQDLENLGSPVSPDALNAAIASAKEGRRKTDLAEAAREYTAVADHIKMYGGAIGPAAELLGDTVDEINRTYGTHYPAVVGGKTWIAQNAEDQRAYQQKVFAQKEKDIQAELKLKDRTLNAQLANWAASREFQQKRLEIENTRANADMLRAVDNGAIDAGQKAIAQVDGELKEIRSNLARISGDKTLTPFQKREASKEWYRKQATAETKRSGLAAALNYVQSKATEDNPAPAPSPTPGTNSGATGGGAVIYNQGGVTITKH